MSGFCLGMLAGGVVGVLGTLALLLIVYSIPDGDYLRRKTADSWRGPAIIAVLIAASGAIFAALHLHRAFATSALLLLVFIAAHLRGLLASWMTLTLAALVLSIVLPPRYSFAIATSQDRFLLVFFVICGLIGTRLVAQRQRV